MQLASELPGLLETLYAAVETPALWTELLDRVAWATQASAAMLITRDESDATGWIEYQARLDPAAVASYHQNWRSRDVFLRSASPLFHQPGAVYRTQSLCADEALEASDFYHGWLRPQGLHQGLGLTVTVERRFAACLACCYPRGAGAGEHAALLRVLSPHLERAVQLRRMLDRLRLALNAASQGSERRREGFLLLDAGGCVLYTSAATETLLEEGRGVGIRSGRLEAAAPEQTRQLLSLVAEAAGAAQGLSGAAGGVLRLGGGKGQRPFVALVTPVSDEGRLFHRYGAAAAVALFDPASLPKVQPEALRRALGLTAAEARLAAALVDGLTPRQAAERLGVSLNTIRTHLQKLYTRTGAAGLTSLVRILVNTARGLW